MEIMISQLYVLSFLVMLTDNILKASICNRKSIELIALAILIKTNHVSDPQKGSLIIWIHYMILIIHSYQ